MKRQSHLTNGLTAGTFLLIGTLAVAQTAPKARNGSAQGSSSSQPAGMAANHQGGNVGAGVEATANSRNSAHATEALQKKHIAGVKYEDHAEPGKSGENPLFESKGKEALKPSTGTVNAQPYKDPEDMTTRYRPGNNKTTKAASNGKTTKVDSFSIKQ